MSGGEIHERDGSVPLTTQQGIPVQDNQNSLKAGDRGPTLLEDFHLREKVFHFDHERIPERVVHARGYGAHGYFENYHSLDNVTSANLFSEPGKRTETFVRFSTVAGSKGSGDNPRDVRGFAVKFYTDQGNWDLVGNNIPVFFIQDAIKFPDLIHAVKPEPDRGFPQAQTAHDNFWDFISFTPESMHMVMWIMSDRTLPRSFRFMQGFGVHTFRFVNQSGESKFVKFHWKPLGGIQSMLWDEAVKVNGGDPDYHRRDLWNAIQSGECPEWELGVQIFDDNFAERFEFDVLDATKLIPEEQIPVQPIGKLVLNRVVDNFFAETEQVAFCTQNVVPGIDFTNDPLLQGRNFSYLDTQLSRLGGPNFTRIPVNMPRCPVHLFQRDGHMTTQVPKGRVNYEPNGWSEEGAGPRESKTGYASFEDMIHGTKEKHRSPSFADHYSQARLFYKSQQQHEQTHITNALVFELSKVETRAIRERMVGHLRQIDETLARTVAAGIGMNPLPTPAKAAVAPLDLDPSPSLSIATRALKTLQGRLVGILVTNGTDDDILQELQDRLQKRKACVKLIAPTIDGVKTSTGRELDIHTNIEGGSSVFYDVIALLPHEDAIKQLQKPSMTEFIANAFHHLKFIGHNQAVTTLWDRLPLGLQRDGGCMQIDGKNDINSFLNHARELRFMDRE